MSGSAIPIHSLSFLVQGSGMALWFEVITMTTCIHMDDIAGEVFHEINQCLNGPLAMEDMVTSTRSTKAWPIREEGQQTLIGYQME